TAEWLHNRKHNASPFRVDCESWEKVKESIRLPGVLRIEAVEPSELYPQLILGILTLIHGGAFHTALIFDPEDIKPEIHLPYAVCAYGIDVFHHQIPNRQVGFQDFVFEQFGIQH